MVTGIAVISLTVTGIAVISLTVTGIAVISLTVMSIDTTSQWSEFCTATEGYFQSLVAAKFKAKP